jgi:hypothetical protein
MDEYMIYLLQSGRVMEEEKRHITSAIKYPCFYSSYDELKPFQERETVVPIGSVEFVKKYCLLNNITLPDNISYPSELKAFLNRKVWSGIYGDVKPEQFCKPKNTKCFTGGIKKDLEEQVKDSEPVWISDKVYFSSEWRFYILNKKILGYSRYDSGDNEQQPNIKAVEEMISLYLSSPVGYCLDVGWVDGKTTLVEANDGWSLGYYHWGNMKGEDYIKLITARWLEIVGNK